MREKAAAGITGADCDVAEVPECIGNDPKRQGKVVVQIRVGVSRTLKESLKIRCEATPVDDRLGGCAALTCRQSHPQPLFNLLELSRAAEQEPIRRSSLLKLNSANGCSGRVLRTADLPERHAQSDDGYA